VACKAVMYLGQIRQYFKSVQPFASALLAVDGSCSGLIHAQVSYHLAWKQGTCFYLLSSHSFNFEGRAPSSTSSWPSSSLRFLLSASPSGLF